MEFDELGKGVVRRREKRSLGLFIDGTGLDRATRRLNRKVELSYLVRGVTSGLIPAVARYYTLIPYEDDSRQRAFLDAVERAGLTVIVKRLPPKGINRQVSVDNEMSADIVAFSLGHSKFSTLSQYQSSQYQSDSYQSENANGHNRSNGSGAATETTEAEPVSEKKQQRIITVVCPSRDLSYPISLAKELGVDTVTADFGQFNNGDILKSAAKWIDLSDSETIWRD